MARAPKTIQEKVQKEFPEFAADVDALSVSDLEARLSKLAKDFEAVDDAQKADEELKSTKVMASELAAPYTDAKKATRLKTKYVIASIRDKGGNA